LYLSSNTLLNSSLEYNPLSLPFVFVFLEI
jgi:hypothetical protein